MSDNPTADELNTLADDAVSLAALAPSDTPFEVVGALLSVAGAMYHAARHPANASRPIPQMLVEANELLPIVREIFLEELI